VARILICYPIVRNAQDAYFEEVKQMRIHFSNKNPKVFNSDLIEEELNALYEIQDRLESK
jgi:hypothetical protein